MAKCSSHRQPIARKSTNMESSVEVCLACGKVVDGLLTWIRMGGFSGTAVSIVVGDVMMQSRSHGG